MLKEADQSLLGPQICTVGPPPFNEEVDPLGVDAHVIYVDPPPSVSEETVQMGIVVQGGVDGLLLQIKETHRLRQNFHRAEKSLTLQIKAIERRLGGAKSKLKPNIDLPHHPVPGADQTTFDPQGTDVSANPVTGEDHTWCDNHQNPVNAHPVEESDGGQSSSVTQRPAADIAFFATIPLQDARKIVKKHRMKTERQLTKLSKQLPVWPWVESVHGFGALGLAQIIGETGNLSNYANPAKLWKRMGLAVIDGKSQRRVKGLAAIEQGYNPVRRSIMYCIGDSMIKKQNIYREVYLARKEIEQSKVPDGTKMLWHRRAQRYMEKRLLKHLIQQWKMI